jgi:hypothetical protein
MVNAVLVTMQSQFRLQWIHTGQGGEAYFIVAITLCWGHATDDKLSDCFASNYSQQRSMFTLSSTYLRNFPVISSKVE